MAYQTFLVRPDHWEIRCTSYGPITHIQRHADGTFTIQEDPDGQIFQPNEFNLAEGRARQIGQDPDLVAAKQI